MSKSEFMEFKSQIIANLDAVLDATESVAYDEYLKLLDTYKSEEYSSHIALTKLFYIHPELLNKHLF